MFSDITPVFSGGAVTLVRRVGQEEVSTGGRVVFSPVTRGHMFPTLQAGRDGKMNEAHVTSRERRNTSSPSVEFLVFVLS